MYNINKREDGKWEVKKQGAKRASKICDTKAEAIAYCEKNQYEYKLNSNDAISQTINSVKKHGLLKTFIIILIIGLLGLGGWFLYSKGYINFNKQNNDITVQNTIEGENFSVHFLELGNEYTGDATYIKAGDNDILIDAGSRKNSAPVLKRYLDQFVTDGKLEYVIATHAHQDHIAGFVGGKEGTSRTGIFYQYKIDTIIDFALTDSNTALYLDYLSARDYAVSQGAKRYSVADCWNNKNGASRSYNLGENLSFDIIYNKYYFEKSTDENEYSVCTMFNAGNHHFLLTGDLEKHGEASIVQYYDGSTPEKTLPEVDVYKAGHHGSPSSSTKALLSKIKPKICCVCCCAGAVEYTKNNDNTFPSQQFINNISQYTDKVYVTTRFNEEKDTFESLNGTIKVASNGTDIAINCSNNNTILKDSEWFNQKVYVKPDKEGNNIIYDTVNNKFYDSTTPGVKEIIRRIWPK